MRCLYHVVVLDGEVVFLPRLVRCNAIVTTAIGGRSDTAPAALPPAARRAYDRVRAAAGRMQGQLDRWRDEGSEP